MATVPMIKKDAQISITIGTGFMKKIQSLFLTLVTERTEEEMESYKKYVESNEEFPETWMENIHTLLILLQQLEQSAIDNNQTYEVDVDDAISQQES